MTTDQIAHATTADLKAAFSVIEDQLDRAYFDPKMAGMIDDCEAELAAIRDALIKRGITRV